jgi:solute:Na+ symporter, SSS family
MKSVNIFDVSFILVYFLIIMGIGLYFMKVNKGGKEYFTGGSMIPWWMSGISLYMGNFSAWIFTGAAGFAYTSGWFTILYLGVGPIAYLIGSHLTAKLWRRTRSISPLQYIQTRYNLSTQQLMSGVIATNFILSAGVQLASTCKLFAPIIGIDMTFIVIIIGCIVLLHNMLGGLWGDMAMDVVQGVVLLGITFTVMPLSLGLIGGFGELFRAMPPVSFDQTYNGVHYTQHWLVSILIITSIGFAAGGAQRFYSVRDEKSAKRVGRLAALLALSVPLVFGIPPLVARVYWPDLAQVDFFKPFIGKNPQDLVFVGLVFRLLPHGLIGVFIAAMLAATMTTLSTVYNMVSSIISHDMYKGVIRPDLSDKALLKVGRITSAFLGLIVMGLAITFIHSTFGLFNQMQAFFTLFNIPVTVPLAFGLIFRRIPRWAALGSILWSLIMGASARYLLGWDIGPQVYLSTILSFGVLLTSNRVAELYRTRKPLLWAVSLAISAVMTAIFALSPGSAAAPWQVAAAIACAVVLGPTLVPLARLFARDTEEDRQEIGRFYARLDTPVDVQQEVFGAGRKQVATLPVVGRTIVFLGVLVGLAFLNTLETGEVVAVLAMMTILLGFGGTLWIAGKRVQMREARELAAAAGPAA